MSDHCRKLVLLKLEKGYDFGDVLLDGSVRMERGELRKDSLVSTTLFKQVKDANKKVCLVAPSNVMAKYQGLPGLGLKTEVDSSTSEVVPGPGGAGDALQLLRREETSSNKKAVSMACELCFDQSLTICHLDLSSSDAEAGHEEPQVKHRDGLDDHPVDELGPPGGDDQDDHPMRKNDDARLMKKVIKYTKKMRSFTSPNGLFISVWPGTRSQNAFCGIAVNKAHVA